MAKQAGELFITGTIGEITFYKMEGQYYARRKSSLTGKRVKQDAKFTRTMESAHRLARGSRLASGVYRSLAREERVKGLFKALISLAIRALKEGKSQAEVLGLLRQRVGKESAPLTRVVRRAKKAPVVRTTPSFTKPLFRVRGGRRERRCTNVAEVQRE